MPHATRRKTAIIILTLLLAALAGSRVGRSSRSTPAGEPTEPTTVTTVAPRIDRVVTRAADPWPFVASLGAPNPPQLPLRAP